MSKYQILTDSGCDLSAEMLQKLNVKMVSLSLLFRGKTLSDSVDDSITDLYEALRAGEAASTSAVNPEGWANLMEPVLAAGQDVLAIAFSSGLSTTYQSAVIAAGDLAEKYPDRQLRVVDSLSASLGQGLLVWYACRKRDEGASLEELAAWVEENKLRLCHWFTVDDLMYLKRGGRVSAATALVGGMLNVKPIIIMDNDGRLATVGKCRGRKTAMEQLVKKLCEDGTDVETIFIAHGDCFDDAKYLEKLLRENHGAKEVFIGYTGAVIGSHSGPGTLAVFFLGNHR